MVSVSSSQLDSDQVKKKQIISDGSKPKSAGLSNIVKSKHVASHTKHDAITLQDNSSLSEKRRMAALIRWGKIGKGTTKDPLESNAVLPSSARKQCVSSGGTVTPPKSKSTEKNVVLKAESATAVSQHKHKMDTNAVSSDSSSLLVRKTQDYHLGRKQKTVRGAEKKDRGNGNSSNERSSLPASQKEYNTEARRRAAIVGWEKRRNQEAAMRNVGFSVTDSVTSISTIPAPPKRQAKKVVQQSVKRSKLFSDRDDIDSRPRSTKRSRRTFQGSQNSFDNNDTKSATELVSYLRISRGWMEFHPSSRYGNGTATYGYIPSSIVSQRMVLEHGTLGMHYALDYEGSGGLREMIEKYGEDYSPHPNEKMMEASHELLKTQSLRVSEWDLGEDLPWRETEQALENECKKRMLAMKKTTVEEQVSINNSPLHSCTMVAETEVKVSEYCNEVVDKMDDLLFVANILASLDTGCANSCMINEESHTDSHLAEECSLVNERCNIKGPKLDGPLDRNVPFPMTEASHISFKECADAGKKLNAMKSKTVEMTFVKEALKPEKTSADTSSVNGKVKAKDDKQDITKSGSLALDYGEFRSEEIAASHFNIEEFTAANHNHDSKLLVTKNCGEEFKADVSRTEIVGDSLLFIQSRNLDFSNWSFGLS